VTQQEGAGDTGAQPPAGGAQGYPQQADQYGYPPQGYPPQGYPPQGYPPQGYPQQGYPPQRFGPPPLPPGVTLASWGARAAAYLVDVVALFACVVPGAVVTGLVVGPLEPGEDPAPLGVVGIILGFAVPLLVWLYQFTWRAGARGQSWGKQVVGIHLVREFDVQPPGGGLGIGRYALRWALGNASCGGYTLVTLLWPLWDDRNQTLDDKMLHTLVVRLPTTKV
jgi:uncharacterized RDD family membrane protein YckC